MAQRSTTADEPRDVDESRPASPTGDAGAATPERATLDRAEQELARQAYKKVVLGQTLNVREQVALKRHEKQREEKLRWQFYASIPQKHWRRMSGRQAKVLHEQAALYGIPFGVATIDLSQVVHALHDFLAANAHKLSRDDDPLLQGAGSPALERYREERAELARLDRQERQRQLVPRDEARQGLARIATLLREAGQTLERQFGAAAADILHEALDDAQREVEQLFGDQSSQVEELKS